MTLQLVVTSDAIAENVADNDGCGKDVVFGLRGDQVRRRKPRIWCCIIECMKPVHRSRVDRMVGSED
jgi:hypothetical protein